MEYEYDSYEFDEKLLNDDNGYWKIISIIDYPDLEFKNEKRKKISLINYRMSALKVWVSNGPQYYVISYSHNVTSYNNQNRDFTINFVIKDENNEIKKEEKLNDLICKNDKNRRKFWTYPIEKEEINRYFSSSADLYIKEF